MDGDITQKPATGCDRPATIEELCSSLRITIESVKGRVADMHTNGDFSNEDTNLVGANVPVSQQANMHANITLVFRHLEDARMRLGKVMQAYQGGISILDK